MDFKGILRKSGSKVTPSRVRILQIFKKSRHPLSAQEIIDVAKKEIDQATVYRILKTFNAKRIIRPIDLRHNHAHYELADLPEHHHIICLRCARVEDVKECNVEPLQQLITRNSKHFSEIQQHSLEFYGICHQCATKRI